MTVDRPTSISRSTVLAPPIPYVSRFNETDVSLPTVGYLPVYPMTGEHDRPMVTKTNAAKIVQTPPIGPGYLGLASGTNPGQIDSASQVRYGLASRPLKTEMNNYETPGYLFGDVAVDSSLVQNAGQHEPPYSVGRDLLTYRTSFNSGGHIIWPLGPRHGIPSRVVNRTIVNLCK